MKTKIILILIIAASIANAAGKAGFNFMKMEYSPRFIATAGTIHNKIGEGGNIKYNPATLSLVKETTAKVSYSKNIEDSYVGDLSFATKLEKGTFGISLSYSNIDDLEGRHKPSEDPEYMFDANSLIIAGAYSYDILDNMSIGLSAKFLQEKIEDDDAVGYSISLGTQYRNFLVENLNLDLSANNFGEMSEMREKKSKLPSSISGGAGYKHMINQDFSAYVGIRDEYILEDEENLLNIGTELGFRELVFARFGYRPENEGMKFSTGIGFKIDRISADYAYTQFTDDMGDNHSFSLMYTF